MRPDSLQCGRGIAWRARRSRILSRGARQRAPQRSSKRYSLDDLWDQIETCFNFWRVRLVLLVRIALRDGIWTQSLCEARQGMRHRFDAGSVGAIQLADEVENARKTALIDRNLGLL